MSNERERVAKALHDTDHSPCVWARCGSRSVWFDKADAAIAAMKEPELSPVEEVAEAFWQALNPRITSPLKESCVHDVVVTGIRAAIEKLRELAPERLGHFAFLEKQTPQEIIDAILGPSE